MDDSLGVIFFFWQICDEGQLLMIHGDIYWVWPPPSSSGK